MHIDLGVGVEIKPGFYFDKLGVERPCVIAMLHPIGPDSQLVFDADTGQEVKDYLSAFMTQEPDE